MRKPLAAIPMRLRPLVAALLLAYLPAVTTAPRAEDTELIQLVRPETSVRLGALSQDADLPRLGQYGGLRERRVYGLVDFDLVQRDDAEGLWLRASGRQLGLDTRELRGEYSLQGRWGAWVDYSRLVRHEPGVFNTGLDGIGTPTQTISGVPQRDMQLSTRRDRGTLGFDVQLGQAFKVQVQYRHEEREGDRLFGRGSGQFLAEPVNSQTQQLDVLAHFSHESLHLVAGYYGTLFVNRHSFIDVNTGADIALAPDNQSHQLSLAGTYAFTPGTRANFKVAYGRATQHEAFFIAPDFPGNVQTDLAGKVDTTSAQVAVSSRLLPELTLLGNARFEDRDDKTPRYQFLAATTGRDGFNTPFSRRQGTAKIEAQYRLPAGVRLSGGVDYDERRRSVLDIRQASWRERNRELGYRLEARAGLAESLSGALSFVRSKRDGSGYLPANNNAAADVIDPIHFADRRRDRTRLNLDWAPTEAWSVQLLADESRDIYDGRPLGPDIGKARLRSLDTTYTLSEDWQIYGFVTREVNYSAQTTTSGANVGAGVAAQTWRANLRIVGDAMGLGVRARPLAKVTIGADVAASRDRSVFDLEAAVPDAARLPDIRTQRNTLRLYGTYEVDPRLTVRLDLASERLFTDDWTWTGWTYADGTTVQLQPRERAEFVGISLVYRMW